MSGEEERLVGKYTAQTLGNCPWWADWPLVPVYLGGQCPWHLHYDLSHTRQLRKA